MDTSMLQTNLPHSLEHGQAKTAKVVFPPNFLWGTATSAYQIEGSFNVDGKLDSIWDVFCRKPGAIQNNDTGEVACDHYKQWKQDIQLLSALGIKAYRFSLSWSRIIPDGDGAVNNAGLDFYDKLIDLLIHYQIEPVITLYHWDLPQRLHEKGGWSSRSTAFAFTKYALTCFERFKDKVKIWITHNEPWVVSFLGYRNGTHAPGVCDIDQSMKTAHHLLLSHGMAVKEMKAYAPNFSGKIGIALNLNPVVPQDSSKQSDQLAAKERELLLNTFYLDALYKGKYPDKVLELYPILDQVIKEDDMKIISTPIDFLGVNYYTRTVVKGLYVKGILQEEIQDYPNDHSTMWEFYPEGLREIIELIWKNYTPTEIIITENGTALSDKVTSLGEVNDDKRIEYIQEHLKVVHHLIEKKIPITGYFAWSFLDNFEWSYGYSKQFGLVYVNFLTQQRILKKSAKWFGNVCKSGAFTSSINVI